MNEPDDRLPEDLVEILWESGSWARVLLKGKKPGTDEPLWVEIGEGYEDEMKALAARVLSALSKAARGVQ